MPTPDWAASGPPLFIFLFCVVLSRAQGTYWLGRAAAAGALAGSGSDGWRGGLARWFAGPVPRKGAALLEHWGLILIPLCFLTVGIQTAVNAGAGLVRLRWRTYTLAMIPGCVAWALLYGAGMLAIWMAVLQAAAGNPWAWLVLAAVVAGVVLTVRRRRRHSPADGSPDGSEAVQA
ncbi:hypothetical protein ACFQ23_08605 [Schaalia naturae]|uniref:Membrane protein DedA with SNARE-associated domain n=1 Tax=Schaalia naturae TaxID=635203 RepID=A0ABW2SM03_9ACTO